MTKTEFKVNELTNKILDYIEGCEADNVDPKVTIRGLKGYLCGLSDGIDFCDEMRECKEHSEESKISLDEIFGKPESRGAIDIV